MQCRAGSLPGDHNGAVGRLPFRGEWLWIVPLAFYTSAYGSAMALFALGVSNLDQALLLWLVMAPAGGLGGLIGFGAAYLPVRIASPGGGPDA